VPPLPCGRRPFGYIDKEGFDNNQRTDLPCKTSWPDYRRRTAESQGGRVEFGISNPPDGAPDNHPQNRAGYHHGRPNHHGPLGDGCHEVDGGHHAHPAHHDPLVHGLYGHVSRSKRKVIRWQFIRGRVLRRRLGLSGHKGP
jgi:hypothetical protein